MIFTRGIFTDNATIQQRHIESKIEYPIIDERMVLSCYV